MLNKLKLIFFLCFTLSITVSAQLKKQMFEMRLIQYQSVLLKQGNTSDEKAGIIAISSKNKNITLNFTLRKEGNDSARFLINENVEAPVLKEITGEKVFGDYVKFNVTIDSGKTVCRYLFEMIYSSKEEKLFYREAYFDNRRIDDEVGDPGRGAIVYTQIEVNKKLPVSLLKPYLSKINRQFSSLVIYWFSSDSKTLLDEYLKLHKYFSGMNNVVFLALDWNKANNKFNEFSDYSRAEESSKYYLTSVFPRYIVVNASGVVTLDRKGFTDNFISEFSSITVK
jgi:hypothetical protein